MIWSSSKWIVCLVSDSPKQMTSDERMLMVMVIGWARRRQRTIHLLVRRTTTKKKTRQNQRRRDRKKMACNNMDEQKHSKLSSLTLVAFEWETKNARETEWEWERIKHSMTLPICFGSVCDNWHKVSVSSNQIKSMLLLCHTQTQTNARAICSTVSWSWHSVTQCNA